MLAAQVHANMFAQCPKCGQVLRVSAPGRPSAGNINDGRQESSAATACSTSNEASAHSSLICAACGENIAITQALSCVYCHADYHADCWRNMGGCTVPTCKAGPGNRGSLLRQSTQAESRQPCPICKKLIPERAQRCRFCGEFVDPHLRAASKKRFRYPRKTSYLAGTSIILGMIGIIVSSLFMTRWILLLSLLFPLASLCIGIWALFDIRKAAGEKSGYWMAGFGLLFGVTSLLKWVVDIFG